MTTRPPHRRPRRPVPAAAAAGLGLVLLVTACADSDDTTTTQVSSATPSESGSDDGNDEVTSNLEIQSGGATSSLEVSVSETLSSLDTRVHDGDTVITLPDRVLFEFGERSLTSEGRSTLDDLVEVMDYADGAAIQVEGHTDSVGSAAANQTLSEQRAAAVRDHLVAAGIDGDRIVARGFGETRPVADNTNPDGSDDPDGRARNRRVEIVIEDVDFAELEDL